MDEARREFLDRVRELGTLVQVAGVLGWDEQTYMPSGSARNRARHNAALASIIHERLTSEHMERLILAMKKQELPTDCEVILREVERDRHRACSMPAELVKEITRAGAMSLEAWAEARRKSDFRIFEPWLTKMIDLKMRAAELIGYEDRLYDAMLDEFEPGMKSRDIDAIFSRLRVKLVPAVTKVLDSAAVTSAIPAAKYHPDEQRKLVTTFSMAMGFDLNYGRIDVSAHPFTIGIGRDVRITVRYDESNPVPAITGAIHEIGHALYEQGLDEKYYCTPLAEAASMGMHESQSRLWENMVGRSLPFWTYFYRDMQQIFPCFSRVPLEDFYREINAARRTLIRVDADELTYNLHIMLRHEIESALFDGRLKAGEIPSFWNERFAEYFGIRVPDDAHGCLQDIHWSMGEFGYFPTYALGNIYAAQFWDAAKRRVPGLEDRMATGDLSPLLGWLRQNVHRHGRRYDAATLIKNATGRPISEDCFIRYVREKYGRLYGITL